MSGGWRPALLPDGKIEELLDSETVNALDRLCEMKPSLAPTIKPMVLGILAGKQGLVDGETYSLSVVSLMETLKKYGVRVTIR